MQGVPPYYLTYEELKHEGPSICQRMALYYLTYEELKLVNEFERTQLLSIILPMRN